MSDLWVVVTDLLLLARLSINKKGALLVKRLHFHTFLVNVNQILDNLKQIQYRLCNFPHMSG